MDGEKRKKEKKTGKIEIDDLAVVVLSSKQLSFFMVSNITVQTL